MTDHDVSDTQILEPVLAPDRAEVAVEAVSIIDGALAQMMQRDLVSSGEIANLLLDLRTLLTSAN